MSSFTNALILQHQDNGKRWSVFKDFGYHFGEIESGLFKLVRAGFVTDLASIPRILRSVIPQSGKWNPAAVLHDAGYFDPTIMILTGPDSYIEERMDRKFWDKAFYEAMLVKGVSKPVAYTMYKGVRAGGWVAWNAHRKNEKRLAA